MTGSSSPGIGTGTVPFGGRGARLPGFLRPAALAALAAVAGGCVSGIDGPQLLDPPPGFGYVANPSLRPGGEGPGGRAIVRERGYARVRGESGYISIVEVEGRATDAEVAAHRKEQEARESAWGARVEPAFETRIDGTRALAWFAEGPHSSSCTAAVLHDDATFFVGFSARDRALRDRDLMLRTVRSFSRDGQGLAGDLAPVLFAMVIGSLLVVAHHVKCRR